jgi:hypothetical protein
VASEVKALANQTTQATEDITNWVNGMVGRADLTVAAISRFAEVIGRVNELQTSIAAAVEEQSATSNEIARAVTMSATTAQATSAGANELAGMSNSLDLQVTELKGHLRQPRSIPTAFFGVDERVAPGRERRRFVERAGGEPLRRRASERGHRRRACRPCSWCRTPWARRSCSCPSPRPGCSTRPASRRTPTGPQSWSPLEAWRRAW